MLKTSKLCKKKTNYYILEASDEINVTFKKFAHTYMKAQQTIKLNRHYESVTPNISDYTTLN